MKANKKSIQLKISKVIKLTSIHELLNTNSLKSNRLVKILLLLACSKVLFSINLQEINMALDVVINIV